MESSSDNNHHHHHYSPLETNRLSLATIAQLRGESGASSLFQRDLVCPVDAEHVVDISRLDAHIADCRRRNAHLGQIKCPFNQYHYTKPEAAQIHRDTCPDRHVDLVAGRSPSKAEAVRSATVRASIALPSSPFEGQFVVGRGERVLINVGVPGKYCRVEASMWPARQRGGNGDVSTLPAITTGGMVDPTPAIIEKGGRRDF